ncbi:hypothetical protein K7I13_08635 [Brucepastera parasyntrophica]|uniref:hypothetical protein n=1 Tax=Brucepastera parasyntrophica TaxID=2880008 RepID=UPI00210EAE83|nr:hypothetical protein [Brucepastera parasyntrophica]ULQ58628.1 hypothetical protein K7I13_08635 [Brucepastera parasyntrophica]
MNLDELMNNKQLKTKEKTEILSRYILNREIKVGDIIDFAETAKDPVKAACIESLEYASEKEPAVINKACFAFAVKNLKAKAPRIKWESARIIGNTAYLFTDDLKDAIKNLLENTGHEGTVVRWSSAFALGEIIKLKTNYNKELTDEIKKICVKEEKNSIKKYMPTQ